MRLITLILVLGILLSCPNLLLAQNQEQKTKILIEEWKQIEKPQVTLLSENKALRKSLRPK